MTRELDKLITDAVPPVPDSGPSRRVTRALLRDRMRKESRRAHRRRLAGVSLAAGLAFLLVLGGQVSDLGSDAFELEIHEVEIGTEEPLLLAKSKIRGTVTNALPGMTSEDIQEMQQQLLLREGRVKSITAFSINGGTPYWKVKVSTEVNGVPTTLARDPIDLIGAKNQFSRELLDFLVEHGQEFDTLVKSGRLEPEPYGDVSANGMLFRVQKWTKEYAGWGTATYFEGTPVNESDVSR